MRDRRPTRERLVVFLVPVLMGLACGSGPLRGGQCMYGGRSRAIGESFASTDGCNICSCTTAGVACTERACVTDGGVDTNNTSEAGADANSLLDAAGGDTDTDRPSDATPGDATSDIIGAGCVSGGHIYAVGENFLSIDGCNTCSCAAPRQIACTLRACIDGPPNNTCSFDRTYRFWDDGGFRAYADRSTLSPARTHTVARDHFANALPNECSRQLTCGDAAAVDVNEFQVALAHGDVVAALSLATKPFYGTDTRPVDGSVFVLERDDQRGFMLGSGTVPLGLSALMDLLHALQAETIASPGCANL